MKKLAVIFKNINHDTSEIWVCKYAVCVTHSEFPVNDHEKKHKFMKDLLDKVKAKHEERLREKNIDINLFTTIFKKWCCEGKKVNMDLKQGKIGCDDMKLLFCKKKIIFKCVKGEHPGHCRKDGENKCVCKDGKWTDMFNYKMNHHCDRFEYGNDEQLVLKHCDQNEKHEVKPVEVPLVAAATVQPLSQIALPETKVEGESNLPINEQQGGGMSNINYESEYAKFRNLYQNIVDRLAH